MTIKKIVCDCCHDTIEGAAHQVPAARTTFPSLDISFDLCTTCMQAYKKRREDLDNEFFGDAVRRMGAYGRS